MIPLVTAITECQREQKLEDIPCEIISTWQPPDCHASILNLYLSNGTLLLTTPWQNVTPFCKVNFNETVIGTYVYNSSIASGSLTIDDNTMGLNAILGIGIIAALLFLLAYKLEAEHYFLKLLLIFSGISIMTLIPLATFQSVNQIFYKYYTWIVRFFWAYVLVFVTYWVYQVYLMKRKVNDDNSKSRQ